MSDREEQVKKWTSSIIEDASIQDSTLEVADLLLKQRIAIELAALNDTIKAASQPLWEMINGDGIRINT